MHTLLMALTASRLMMKTEDLVAAADIPVVEGFIGIPVWDRPTDGTPDAPNPDAQAEYGERLSALLQEGINRGVAGGFLTPSEKGTTLLVAATIPMQPLTITCEDGSTVTTNKWALNLNVAIPKERKDKKAEEEKKAPSKALSIADLRASVRAAREAK